MSALSKPTLLPADGSPHFSRSDDPLEPAAKITIDAALADLTASKQRWVSLELPARLAILDEISRDLQAVANRWVAACIKAKGLTDANSFAQGEEWVFLAALTRLVRLLRESLADIQRDGRPRLPGPLTTRPGGQVVAPVLPQNLLDPVMFPGTRAEVWQQPGQSVEGVLSRQALFYRRTVHQGQVLLVLGAGNVSTLAPADFLHALFVKGQVVVLKPSPVNDYLGPLLERAFRALIRRGFLRIVYGGPAVGDYLSRHSAVEAIHLTGSDKTFEAVVFGPGPDGAHRQANRQPRLTKPVTAELGNVSPIIVAPGPWSAREVQLQARKIATWLVINAGFNCLTPRVIITAKAWPQREALLAALGRALAETPTRPAYYPGAPQRHAHFTAGQPPARTFGPGDGARLPWTIVPGVDPADTGHVCFRSEAFCGLLAETALEAASLPNFLERAVDFANNTLWGSLTATVMVHPRALRDQTVAAAVERALARLQYGTVLLNQYGGYAYYLMLTTWGAFPGHNIYDIQSGIGVVNNVLMFNQPQKTVVRSPFHARIDPVILTFRHFDQFGRKLASLEAAPSLLKLPGLLWERLRG